MKIDYCGGKMNELQKIFTMRTVPCKFGVGATQEVGFEVKKINAQHVLIVCDQTISKQTNILEKIIGIIEGEGIDVQVWDKVEPEPTTISIQKAIDSIEDSDFDCLVGIGGGSTISTSKIINLYCSYPKDFHAFFPSPLGKSRHIPGRIKPLIVLPTTAGTGSEASAVANISVLDESGNRRKAAISSEYLLPDLAILDPINTVTMPPQLTASSGLDALLIAIGVYTAKPFYTNTRTLTSKQESEYIGSNPFSDLFAEKAIELCSKYIRRVYANGFDIEAREGMLFASHLAGIAAGKAGTHIPHANAISIGEKVQADAGIRVAVTSPACFDFIAPFLPGRMKHIAELLSGETGNTLKESQFRASHFLIALLKDLKCPNGISELGLGEKDIPELSERAFQEKRLLAQTPRFITRENIEEIFRASLKNW
ncbi:MAG: iron-containing alcohol dehydrogenase [Deltaproteobacteria bacterium]|nr:MAG: iron-containing alcohol dehydrogenase [Deltaproteobacteria bacterium]